MSKILNQFKHNWDNLFILSVSSTIKKKKKTPINLLFQMSQKYLFNVCVNNSPLIILDIFKYSLVECYSDLHLKKSKFKNSSKKKKKRHQILFEKVKFH